MFIDGLQAMLSLALAGLVSGIGGALTAGIAIPLGIVLGFVVNATISLSFGGAFLLALGVEGMFYPGYVFRTFFGEATPGINNLPLWTTLAVLSVIRKSGEEKGGSMLSSIAGTLTQPQQALMGKAALGARVIRTPERAPAQPKPRTEPATPRAPLLPGRFNDIRPAARGAALALLLMFGIQTCLPAKQAHAQTVPAPVQYIVAPEAPGAHENVAIEIQGVGSFLGSANITWSKDGKAVKEGIGERSYTFVTGALGEKTTVRATIDSSQGVFTRTFTFNPSRVNLIWEADTTVPLLYQGKALYSAGSNYKVVALPTVYSGSARVAASVLSYQWIYRGDPVPEVSGLGRNIFTRTGDQLQPGEDVAVDVYYGVNKVGHAELFLPATAPFILLYQYDALRGILYDAALPAAISLAAKEITIKAEAFYFSTATAKSGLIPFVWTLSGTETTGPDSARGILTLRQTGSGSGSANIGVSMQNNNPNQLVQSAQTTLQLVFGAAQSNSLFNFIGL